MFRTILTAAFIFCFTYTGFSQQILPYPSKYKKPKYDYNFPETINEFSDKKSKPSKDLPWAVYCDRVGTAAFEKPKDDGVIRNKLDFGQVYWVTEEKDGWVQIYAGKADKVGNKFKVGSGGQEMGWIQKERMLLWTHPLVDQETGIVKKVLLLNNKQDIIRGKFKEAEVAPIYNKPSSQGEALDGRSLYDFYFVMKIEGDTERMFLISKFPILETSSTESGLVGWVSEGKIKEWDTRVALEPNFEGAAFKERKDKDRKVKGFKDQFGAVNYNASEATTGVTWDGDMNDELLTFVDDQKTRLRGDVIRFPFLSNYDDYEQGYIYSGIIATLTSENNKVKEEKTNVFAEETIKYLRNKSSNLNVCFVVEGTSDNTFIKTEITNMINDLERGVGANFQNTKYAAVVYKDEKDVGNLSIEALTKDRNKISNFIASQNFVTNDEGVALAYHALDEALLNANFKKNESNLIVMIGSSADISQQPLRKRKADKKYLVEINDIVEQLVDYEAHTFFIQSSNATNSKSRLFSAGLRGIVVEAAKQIFEEYRSYNLSSNVRSAEYEDPDFASTAPLSNCGIKSVIIRPEENQNIRTSLAKTELVKVAKTVSESNRNKLKFAEDVGNTGISIQEVLNQVNAGQWAPEYIDVLMRFLKENGKRDPSSVLSELKKRRYKLFDEVYFPAKIHKLDSDPFTYVIFMDEKELRDYNYILERLRNTQNQSSDVQRDELQAMYRELLKTFTGGDKFKDEISEILSKITGLASEIGRNFFPTYEYSDIQSKKKMSDQTIFDEISRINQLRKGLAAIIDQGANYEFSYKPPGGAKIYYWVPVEQIF